MSLIILIMRDSECECDGGARPVWSAVLVTLTGSVLTQSSVRSESSITSDHSLHDWEPSPLQSDNSDIQWWPVITTLINNITTMTTMISISGEAKPRPGPGVSLKELSRFIDLKVGSWWHDVRLYWPQRCYPRIDIKEWFSHSAVKQLSLPYPGLLDTSVCFNVYEQNWTLDGWTWVDGTIRERNILLFIIKWKWKNYLFVVCTLYCICSCFQ